MESLKQITDLVSDMIETKQFKNLNVLEHGELVFNAYELIIKILEGNIYNDEYNLPEELFNIYKKYKNSLLDLDIVKRYQIFHDCGKPYCIKFDNNGDRHFPNHAEISYEMWKKLFPNDKMVYTLMRHDMDFHIKKADELKEIIQKPFSFTLYLSSWASIYANAEMFGGLNSKSFKIKKKTLKRRMNLFK